MSWLSNLFPPLSERLAAGRPVLTREQMTDLTRRILGMTSSPTVRLRVTHIAQVVTRLANGQVLSGDDGDQLEISFYPEFGARQSARVRTNQLDERVLKAMVQQGETIGREGLGPEEEIIHYPQRPDALLPTQLWKEATIRAMQETRSIVIPRVLSMIEREGLVASGFLGLTAQSEIKVITQDGISVYSEETDSELTVTARSQDGQTSGWGGAAARDWSQIDHETVARHAIEIAQRSANASAVEPGRRTAILSAESVTQIVRYLAPQFFAQDVDGGETALSKLPRGNKLGQRVFDPRISMRSDPADPDGGYCPYFWGSYGNPAMTWVEDGILKNLAYSPPYAMGRGKAYAEMPYSIRISGGNTSIAEMIASCKEGIYVNRLSGVDEVDRKTGLVSGVTQDGCFLIKNGKIDRPVKNFRILESPFFFLNNIEALGPTKRAAFGYTPKGMGERMYTDWPRRPIIAPPMMVRDFNFSVLVDAI